MFEQPTRDPRTTMPPDADPTAAARPRVLRCAACGRTEPHTTTNLRRLARTKWPECCGEPMPVARDPDTQVPFAEPVRERRSGRRRLGRSGVRAEVRRGPLGMGPNLADGLVEVSEAGARVRLKLAVPVGEQFEVALWPPSCLKAVRERAVVRWCRPGQDGAFLAGVRFRRRLTADEVLLLADGSGERG